MRAIELLDRARKEGLAVIAEGDRLKFTGKRKHLPLIDAIAAVKPEILALFATEPQSSFVGEHRSRAGEPIEWGRRIGRGLCRDHGCHPLPAMDTRTVATVAATCPACHSARVLPELTNMSGQICWNCWTVGRDRVGS